MHVPDPGLSICYAAKANAWVVRSNGDLGKCTVGLNDPRNKVGSLRKDGTIEVDLAKWRPWLQGIASLDEQYLSCPYSAMLNEERQAAVLGSSPQSSLVTDRA